MIPIDIQVSRWKVKVKDHASLFHLVQLITQERFAQQPLASCKWRDAQCATFPHFKFIAYTL